MELQSVTLDPPVVDWPRRAVSSALRHSLYPGKGIGVAVSIIGGAITLGLFPLWRTWGVCSRIERARRRQLQMTAQVTADPALADALMRVAATSVRPMGVNIAAALLLVLSGAISGSLIAANADESLARLFFFAGPWSAGVMAAGVVLAGPVAAGNVKLARTIGLKKLPGVKWPDIAGLCVAGAIAYFTAAFWIPAGVLATTLVRVEKRRDAFARNALADHLQLEPPCNAST